MTCFEILLAFGCNSSIVLFLHRLSTPLSEKLFQSCLYFGSIVAFSLWIWGVLGLVIFCFVDEGDDLIEEGLIVGKRIIEHQSFALLVLLEKLVVGEVAVEAIVIFP
jgi:hypothetical protein